MKMAKFQSELVMLVELVGDEPVAMSFRENSAQYERNLISEVGSLLREVVQLELFFWNFLVHLAI